MARLDKLTYKESLFSIIDQYYKFAEKDGILFFVPSTEQEKKIFQELGYDVSGVPVIKFCEDWEELGRELWNWWPGGVYCGFTAGELYEYFFSRYEREMEEK